MHKKFLRNLALLVFLNLLVKPFWIFGIDRVVQNRVGPESYGFYFAVLNFSFLFYILLDLGITNFNNRNIAQNNQLLAKHLAGIGSLKLVLGLFYAVFIFVLGVLIGYNEDQLYLLAWVGLNQFLLSFILYLRSNLGGLLLFRTDSLISVLDRLLMIVICGVLLWTHIFGGRFYISWFVYAQTVAYLLTTLVALVAVLNRSGRLRFNWNVAFFLMILKKSLPFALLALLMSFYNRIDPVLVERLLPGALGESQSGVYAQAFRLLDAGQNFAFLFSVLLLPIFSRMLKDKQPVMHLVQLAFGLMMAGVLIVLAIALFFGKEVMMLLYTPAAGEATADYLTRISESALIFKLLMFSFVAVSSVYIFGTLLTAHNNLKQLNLVAFAGLAINLVMNFLLIPRFMAVGSAYANVTAQLVTAIIQVILAYRILKLRFDLWYYARLLSFFLVLLLLGFLASRIPGIDWKTSCLILIMSGIASATLLRLVNLKEFFELLRPGPGD